MGAGGLILASAGTCPLGGIWGKEFGGQSRIHVGPAGEWQ